MAEFAKGELKEELDEVSQKIDLIPYLGRKPTDSEKQAFAEAAIETIKQRTLNNKDVNGNKFEKYSKEYAAKKGVSRSSVDLFLEGDMLDSLNRVKSGERVSEVKIKLKSGLQTKKAYNHQTGDTLPQRRWFGLLENEAKQIVNQIKETREESGASRLTLKQLREAIAILGLEQEE